MSGTKFIIESRYQYWRSIIEDNKDPIWWTAWFSMLEKDHDTKESAEARLKELTNMCKQIDKSTGLKHEFRIIEKEN